MTGGADGEGEAEEGEERGEEERAGKEFSQHQAHHFRDGATGHRRPEGEEEKCRLWRTTGQAKLS